MPLLTATRPAKRQGSAGWIPTISIPVTVAVIALLGVAAVLVVRVLPLSNLPALVLAAAAPYAALAALAALMIAALCRRRLLFATATVLLVAAVTVQAHWYFLGSPEDAGPRTTELRILSSNIQKGEADARFFVDLAVDHADVITVPELTAEAVTRFREAGIRKHFPYSILHPRPGADGMGLWSRYPLTELQPSTHRNAFIASRVRVPGVRDQPIVAGVHLMSPLARGANTFDAWLRRITAARAEFADYAETAGPAAVIIAGDFNATADMRQFRDLLDIGYRDAVNQTGAGFMPTYSPHPWIPPLIAIDHVLTRNSAAQSIHSVDIPGSDHRALLATVAISLDPNEP